jgi:hypothetical protein
MNAQQLKPAVCLETRGRRRFFEQNMSVVFVDGAVLALHGFDGDDR